MSNTFNIKRFGRYWVYDLKMAWKRYGYGFLFTSLFPIVFYILGAIFHVLFGSGHNLSDYHGIDFDVRIITFIIAWFILVLTFPKSVYGHVTNKEIGSAWLMLPASRLEKFISMMVNCLLIIPIVFLALYFGSDALMTAIEPQMGKPIALAAIHYYNSGNLEGATAMSSIQISSFAFIVLILISILQYMAIFLTGAVYFRRRKILMTILVLIGLQIILIWIINIKIFFGGSSSILEWSYSDQITAQGFANFLNWTINIWTVLVLAVTGTMIWLRLKKLQH
jgi:hypothetical protein